MQRLTLKPFAIALSVIMLAPILAGGACQTSGPSNADDPNNYGATPGGTDTNPIQSNNAGGVIADHRTRGDFDNIPQTYIDAAKTSLRIFYGHTSHGSQLVTGAEMLAAEDSRYAVNAGTTSLSIREDDGADLGANGNLDWTYVTRDVLNEPGSDINVVIWSWCGGVSDNSSADINTYLNAMNQLESDYPSVQFVYMTGHLDGTGPTENLYQRNNQIRDYCAANSKILFDFADIESYDPDGGYYGSGSDACEWCYTWCATHDCPDCDDCAHSHCMNCYQKGKAFWWILARMAGWDGE